MTAFDRFDPFDQRISAALDAIAVPQRPDYLDDILGVTARTAQRPRWAFPERWLPLDTAMRRSAFLHRVPLRPLVLLVILALLAATVAALWVGSQRRVPPPFGPAANGAIAYPDGGDLYVRDSLTGDSRLLVGGPGSDAYPFYSPDGTRIAYSTTIDGREYLKVANADGSGIRQLLPDPLVRATAVWRPDSAALAIVSEVAGRPALLIVPVDGSPARRVDLGDVLPSDVQWRPPDGLELLVRGSTPNSPVDLYVVDAATGGARALGLPSLALIGAEWDLGGPVWSPDGTRIAYNQVELDAGADPRGHFRVHLVNADGTGDVALPPPADHVVQEAWPLFSPDGRWILVHRWTWTSSPDGGFGWLAVMPADGSAPARDIGPRIPGGEHTGLIKTWSPDGSRVLMRSENEEKVYSIDPVTGATEALPWATDLPDWQRVAT
jgi:Tol biopolymer transport system component